MKSTSFASARARLTSQLMLAGIAFLVAGSLPAQQAGESPLKIFILAGQSNMVGMGEMSPVTTPGTLEFIIANNPDYAFMGDGHGGFAVREDVWIRDEDGNGGGLTAGYGGSTSRIGPELGFGHAVGELYDEQVLIIKTAWGGRSLGLNFLPPSSGPYPEPTVDGDPGYHYKLILDIVADVTSNLATYFPDYDGRGYEIAGFCWHQGWNDRIDPGHSDAYETNMANFINDIRNDLGVPDLPFVIATSAMDPNFRYTQVEEAQLAMADADRQPTFDGNVSVIDARQTYKGLEFWQLSFESPRNEGYHWNRNAKTYTNLGLAMADAISVMVPARCPYRLEASGDSSGVALTWSDGTESPDHLQVLRNGVEIAASAPLGSPDFLDATAEPGVIDYQLNFTMPGEACPPLTLTFDAGITGLEAYRVQDKVKLRWTNNLGYTAIAVRRNGEPIEPSLAGTATSYLDTSPLASGAVTYSVVPTNGSATPTETSINLDGLSPGNAHIYEPFEDADPSLSENVTGAGLDKRWVGGLNVAPDSMSYGALPTSGNQSFNGGGNTSAGALIRPELAEAGLLDHGSELWFSFLTNNTTGVNTAVYFVLGTDQCGFFSGMEDGGEGIGVNLSRGSTPEAATWAPNRSAGSSTGLIDTDTTALIVGKITWGANAGAADTVEIYLPGTDLALPGSPVSTRSAILDQSQFDVVGFGGKNAGSPKIDEIRFAGSYDDVVALDQIVDDTTPPAPDPMSWASPPAADGDGSISMTATTATDGSGVEYYFAETSGNTGGSNSGWQDSPTYTDDGLEPNTTYSYTVSARDKSSNQNATQPSTPVAQATTDPLDNEPPATPGFEVEPNAISTTEITMTASLVTDPSGVEYHFTETSGNPGGSDSGWQDSPSYTDTGLDPSTTYTYTVMARDKSASQNASGESVAFGATTPDPPTGPGGAFIYEPFADPDPSLANNEPGIGLSGTWSSDSGAVVAGSIGYGLLPTDGSQVRFGSSYGSITPDETLDGLLGNGSTLWFSLTLHTGSDVGTNPDIGFALGTNRINDSNNLPMSDAGDGGLAVGFTIKQGQLRASWWDAGDGNGPAVSRASTNSGNSVTTESTYLIVGELVFGATDTIRIYLPDTEFNPGPAVSTAEVSFDQTLFDTISFAAKGAGAPHAIDEIRFGTSYEAAIGLAGDGDDYGTWAKGFPTADLGDPDADFDGDGMTNDEERIWGTDPTDPGSVSPFAVALNPVAGTFSYTRRDDSLTGLTYRIWTSTDLADWTEDTKAEQLAGALDDKDVETVLVTLDGPLLAGPRLFVRVTAE